MNKEYRSNDLNGRCAEREWMVHTQLMSRDISDEAVINSMVRVPRHRFVMNDKQELAYYDTALEIEAGQTISQPYMVALMAQALKLKASDRVLEVGTGSGYSAGILSQIASRVYTIERHQELAKSAEDRLNSLGYNNIEVHVGDGTLGWAEKAPFDAVLVTAGGPVIPDPLLEQLAVGGRLVIPVGEDRGEQHLLRVKKTVSGKLIKEDLGAVRFVPLIGTEGWNDENGRLS
ncbi:protein-L-isoaspartate and D-aspartate O-methyltransferase [Desulfosporosinus orientis DSM 765]|uniref:Protein-L-isoaspartate O-methyltransferase n=1 Tax=Desulfosporosinus orientis (strain ATCC 19365 / DSM 765 / NCIMB 8382 / VKM B-1628 / Singapore I) TaxID=768706 RepID=G7WCP0_DESOD|nr:protein-L-isoaspartate(D-aspartate) O-methyltransferase [Desulfosporosinus orientis]AET66578.1 protein-L-isoaspartate and D-aspartate O-methyltransferase [Desulfosporosinus orientis DSM 765]